MFKIFYNKYINKKSGENKKFAEANQFIYLKYYNIKENFYQMSLLIDQITKEKKDYFLNNYSSLKWDRKKWSKFLGVSIHTLSRYAKSRGIEKAMAFNSGQFKTKWNEEKEKILKEFYSVYTVKQLEDMLGIGDEAINKKLKSWGLKKPMVFKNKLALTEEVKKSLLCPYLSNEELSRDYDVSPTTIGNLRKKIGVAVRNYYHIRPSLLEIEVMSVLDELDLAYIYNKKINGKEVDFYLGNKKAIEVNGEQTHKSLNIKKRDFKKLNYLKNLGYELLYLCEYDLFDRNIIKNKIKKFIVSLFSNKQFKKQGERKKKRCEEKSLLTVKPSNYMGNTVPSQLVFFS
jgi:hypothetical protein